MRIQRIVIVTFLFVCLGCQQLTSEKTQKFNYKSGELLDSDGNKISSTIDPKTQHFADSLLNACIQSHNAESACVIIMETKTGAIKSMVSLLQNSDGSFISDSNLAVNDYHEFGSVFNLYSALVLLENGLVKLDDSVLVGNGSLNIGNITISDAHKLTSNKMTFRDGFTNASNVVFSSLIYNHYHTKPEGFLSYMDIFNLNRPLPIDISGHHSPTLKKTGPSDWNDSALQYLSIGYGVKLSPLHILTMYNAIANDGGMIAPCFASENLGKAKIKQVCMPKTAKILKELLESTVRQGTASNLWDESISIAGKTGTSLISSGGTINYLASFVGHFPTKEPKYTCLVMINNPRNGSFYGSCVAGPVFKEIARFLKY